MQRTSRRRLWMLILPLVFIAWGGLALAWAEGAPLWWVLRGSRVEKVIVHWDQQRVEITDAQQVQQFYQAVRSGSSPLPYATRCLADKHPENWSVTLIRTWQPPFQVQVGIDTCGAFYVPEVGSTYMSGKLMPLIKETLKTGP